jgi:ABC-type multidrug transport system ATPase subunit
MLGVSGAGKSTLLKVLAGRQHGGQRGGDVFINGGCAWGKPGADVRRRARERAGVVLSRRAHSHLIGFVEAAPSLGSCSTVEEALRFAARMRCVRREGWRGTNARAGGGVGGQGWPCRCRAPWRIAWCRRVARSTWD